MSTVELSNIPLYQWRTLPLPPTLSTSSRPSSRTTSQSSTPISSPLIHSHATFKDSITTQTLKTFLPRLALQDSPDHAINIQKLHYFRECFQKKEFWDECTILEKMHYKNKSQHRQAGYFKRLCECRRIISRIKEMDIATLMDELIRKFYSGISLKSVESTKAQWDSIPHRSTVAFTMTRIIGSILLLKKLQSVLHETYGAFFQLMSKTQFMPFALVTIGLTSRLSLITKAWLTEYVDCYALLGKWIKCFPNEKAGCGIVDYESQLPDSIECIFADDFSNDISDEVGEKTSIQSTEQLFMEKMDLGEVIQRTDPLSQLDDLPPSKSQSQSRNNLPRPLKTSIRNSDDDSDSVTGEDDTQGGSDAAASSHPTLLSSNIKSKKVQPLPDIDHIFGRSMKQNSKDKKKKKKSIGLDAPESMSSLTPPLEQNMSSKNKIGSKSNFDDIFSFDTPKKTNLGSSSQTGNMPIKSAEFRKKPGSSKREIDDIFSSNKKHRKKSKASTEIDDIFGTGQKKKK
ncbi:hypothetical protein BGZ76_007844 [Entomortierella beljakovae]|nr:hypothetical protein BGZ76_007844 [Entomortierella beljakovae]